MKYREIDHVLLNLNKGRRGAGRNGPAHGALPGPGDHVVVSATDRSRLVNILIHRVYADSQTLMGKTLGDIYDEAGHEIIKQNAHVSFSYKKIAGIQRQ